MLIPVGLAFGLLLVLVLIKTLVVDRRVIEAELNFPKAKARLYKAIFLFVAPSAYCLYEVVTFVDRIATERFDTVIPPLGLGLLYLGGFGVLYFLLAFKDAQIAQKKLRRGA